MCHGCGRTSGSWKYTFTEPFSALILERKHTPIWGTANMQKKKKKSVLCTLNSIFIIYTEGELEFETMTPMA